MTMDCSLRLIHNSPLSTTAFLPKKVRLFTVKCSSSQGFSSVGGYCFYPFNLLHNFFIWVDVRHHIYARKYVDLLFQNQSFMNFYQGKWYVNGISWILTLIMFSIIFIWGKEEHWWWGGRRGWGGKTGLCICWSLYIVSCSGRFSHVVVSLLQSKNSDEILRKWKFRFSWKTLEGSRCSTSAWGRFNLEGKIVWCIRNPSWGSGFQYIFNRVRFYFSLIVHSSCFSKFWAIFLNVLETCF